MGNARYRDGFRFTMHHDKVREPLLWRKPRRIFVNSMSDLFHEDAPTAFIEAVFETMQQASWHQYQVLTKRPERASRVLGELQAAGSYQPAPHIWIGTSVESNLHVDRVRQLQNTPAGVRFLSCEPLLSPLPAMDLQGIHWLIAGGESGTHLWDERLRTRRALVDYSHGQWLPRPERMDWIRSLRDQCVAQQVAFFFKQWGGATPKAAGRLLDGILWSEYPDHDSAPRSVQASPAAAWASEPPPAAE
jgi:protein gp37